MAIDFLDRLDPDEDVIYELDGVEGDPEQLVAELAVPDHPEFMARTLESRSDGEFCAVPITLDDLMFLLGGGYGKDRD